MRHRRSAKAMEEIAQYYLSQGFQVEPLMQEDIHHYCLVHVHPSEMRIQTFAVMPDRDEAPELLEEIVIPRAEHASLDPTNGTRKPSDDDRAPFGPTYDVPMSFSSMDDRR